MEFHEIANIFPLIEGAELDELVKDIKDNGLIEPITTYNGKIIDGRNRYRACELAGVAPVFEEWKQNGASLTEWIIAKNLHRRHLNSGQKATCSLDALLWLKQEAKERQLACLAQNTPQVIDNSVPQKIAERGHGEAREKAAEMFGTNRQYVDDAKKLKNERPDLFEKVKDGSIKITQAKREMVKDNVKKEVQLPSDKYRIIYADPPWSYNDKLSGDLSDNYGGAEKHYPAMAIEQLCAMDVKSISEDNAVLFIWVTSPLLEDVFKVINSWGFSYKTSFVWDKVKHNMGHYNSVRHEFLLICTRGSCTPDEVKLFDSVQSIERTDRHSEKPEEFRNIIDTLYPHGRRIELFARKQADGWECHGNEL